jgi:hypothetical protein
MTALSSQRLILGSFLHFVEWLFLTVLREALESERIKFLRYPEMIGYGGNGAAVITN